MNHTGLFSRGTPSLRLLKISQWNRQPLSIRRHQHVLANIPTKTTPQIYISTSSNPYVNLSIEHYLLTTCHPASSILFLYINGPCVVLGRNQNPWLEVNLRGLKTKNAISDLPFDRKERLPEGSNAKEVELVRRRSGGGTVFHDAGNLNYCTITPRTIFNRDRSALMVARALQGVQEGGMIFQGNNIRVNERHDIVMDLSTTAAKDTPSTVKISGSAYKLTSSRALHHGTLLLASPNINQIGYFLRSPARDYIQAKGVESVSSKIGNVLDVEQFAGLKQGEAAIQKVMQAIGREFWAMSDPQASNLQPPADWREIISIGDDAIAGNDEIAEKISAGVEELKSLEWKYLQTPAFTIFPPDMNDKHKLEVKHGLIQPSQTALHTLRDFSQVLPADAPILEKMSTMFPVAS